MSKVEFLRRVDSLRLRTYPRCIA